MIQCYYLNLDKREDRKKHIECQLNKSKLLSSNYKRFSAIDGKKINPRHVNNNILSKTAVSDLLNDTINTWGLSLTTGGLGVLLSYIELFKIISKGEDNVLLFEDDVDLVDGFDDLFLTVIKELPFDFDICYLGYGNTPTVKPYSNHLQIPTGVLHCLPSIYVSPNGAKKMLSLLKNIEHQIDTFLFSHFDKLNVFVSSPRLVSIKNQLGSDIQGDKNHSEKMYKKQNYVFVTLAVGKHANENALRLAKDFKYFHQKLLIVTDTPEIFVDVDNVVTQKYNKTVFSYNHKYLCYEFGFSISDAVVYLDSDTRIFFDDYKTCYTNFFHTIVPGFHPSWDWGKINRPSGGFFTSTDISSRVNGYGELALELCKKHDISEDKAYHYQEGFLILSKEDGKEKVFIDTWKMLADELDAFEIKNGSKSIGLGEGNIVGLAIEKSKMTIHTPDMCNILGEHLKYNFQQQCEDYLKKYPNRKIVKSTNGQLVKSQEIHVDFKDKQVDLSYSVYKIENNMMLLEFEWNRNNQVEMLDHEFKVNDKIYHFNSEKMNSFIFIDINSLSIEHTYDWYGERDWKKLF